MYEINILGKFITIVIGFLKEYGHLSNMLRIAAELRSLCGGNLESCAALLTFTSLNENDNKKQHAHCILMVLLT